MDTELSASFLNRANYPRNRNIVSLRHEAILERSVTNTVVKEWVLVVPTRKLDDLAEMKQ